MEEILIRHLNILKSNEEKENAYENLAFLGLQYYFLMYPKDQVLNIATLYQFSEKLLKEWNKQPPSSSKAPISSQMIKEHGLHRHYGSKYRPEALSHFPFVDEGGTVYDIFHNNCGRPNLLTMGEAGRNRLILKVFEAMRLDSHGIRLSDLPEALQMVGIDIPESLKRLLEKTRSKNTTRPLRDSYHDYEDNWESSEYVEKYITLSQWKQVIRNILLLKKQGKDFNSMEDLLHGGSNNHQPHHPPQEDDLDLGSGRGNDEHKSAPRFKSYVPRPAEVDEEEWSQMFTNLRKGRKAENDSEGRRSPTTRASLSNKSYYRNLKKVKSRIGDLINKDKQDYFREKSKTDHAALSTIAKQRVDKLTSRNIPPSIRDPEFFQSVPFVKGKEANIFRDTVTMKDHKTSEKPIARLKDLSSGMAALQIADSFLNSRVGKELTATIDREIFPEDISAKAAETYAAKILGLSSSEKRQNGDSDSDRTELKDIIQPRPGNHFNKSTAILTGDQIHDYKRQYVTGWKGSKGGWVADFGPDHTRAFYTGPERARTSLREKVEPSDPVAVDDMLLNVARDIHGVAKEEVLSPNDSDYSSSQVKSDEQQEEKIATIRVNKTAYNDIPVMDMSESSLMSPFPNSSEVRGKGPMLSGMDFSDDSNDELLGKLQDSVNLTKIAGKSMPEEVTESSD